MEYFAQRLQVTLAVKNLPANARALKTPGFDPWVGKISRRRECHPTPGFLPEKPHGQRNLVGYSPGGHKESDTTEHTFIHIIRADVIFFPV